MISFYKFECDYWTDYMDEDAHAQGLLAAEGYIDAIEKLERRLCNISNVHIDEWLGDNDFIFAHGKDYIDLISLLDKIEREEDDEEDSDEER